MKIAKVEEDIDNLEDLLRGIYLYNNVNLILFFMKR